MSVRPSVRPSVRRSALFFSSIFEHYCPCPTDAQPTCIRPCFMPKYRVSQSSLALTNDDLRVNTHALTKLANIRTQTMIANLGSILFTVKRASRAQAESPRFIGTGAFPATATRFLGSLLGFFSKPYAITRASEEKYDAFNA